jgi:hypothetical protein
MSTPLLTSLAMIAVVSSALAATPPARMNYQGVLRDASEAPLGGDHDMVFRFFDAATLGNEILVDRHLAAGTGAVTVSGGLFAVALGSGNVTDGSGPGVYTSLTDVFRDHANVWLEVQAGAEVLSPRIQVLSAGYALNADHLDGLTASAFGQRDGDNNWTAANSFTNASNSFTGSGAGLSNLNAGNVTSGVLPAARGGTGLGAVGSSGTFLRSNGAALSWSAILPSDLPGGSTSYLGRNTADTSTISAPGFIYDLTNSSTASGANGLRVRLPTVGSTSGGERYGIDVETAVDDSTSGGFLSTNYGVRTYAHGAATASGHVVSNYGLLGTAGDSRSVAGTTANFGVYGDAPGSGAAQNYAVYGRASGTTSGQSYGLYGTAAGSSAENYGVYARASGPNAGTNYGVYGEASGASTANWAGYFAGDVNVTGDIALGGNDLRLGGGGTLSGTDVYTALRGNESSDLLYLWAGNSSDDGGLLVNGGSTFLLYSGNGLFSFRNGAAGNDERASLDGSGNLQIDGDLTASGGDIVFANGLAANSIRGEAFDLLSVSAGLTHDEGGFTILSGAGGTFDLHAGSGGDYSFNIGGTAVAQLLGAGDLQIDGDLQVDGGGIEGPAAANFSVHAPASLHLTANSNVRTVFDFDNSTTTNLAEWFHDVCCTAANKVAELQEDGDFRIRGVLSQNVAFDLAESFLASAPVEPGDLVRVDPSRSNAVLPASASDRGLLGVVSERPGVLLGGAPFDPAALRDTWGEAVHDAFVAEREVLESALLEQHPDLADDVATIRRLEERLGAAREASADAPAGSRPSNALDAAHGISEGEIESLVAQLEAHRADFANRLEGLALERFFQEQTVAVALAGRVPVKVTGPVEVGDPLGPSPVPGVAMRAEKAGAVIGIALESRRGGQGKVLAFVSRGYAAAADPQAASSPTPADAAAPNVPLSTVVPSEALPIAVDSAKGERTASRIAFTEEFPVLEPVAPGDVVVASSVAEGSLALSREPRDPAVVGVVAPANGHGDPKRAAVVLSGTVLVKADAAYGAIRVGDPLTASPTPGHAMLATEPLPGTILGKAITALGHGTGYVRLLVMPR